MDAVRPMRIQTGGQVVLSQPMIFNISETEREADTEHNNLANTYCDAEQQENVSFHGG